MSVTTGKTTVASCPRQLCNRAQASSIWQSTQAGIEYAGTDVDDAGFCAKAAHVKKTRQHVAENNFRFIARPSVFSQIKRIHWIAPPKQSVPRRKRPRQSQLIVRHDVEPVRSIMYECVGAQNCGRTQSVNLAFIQCLMESAQKQLQYLPARKLFRQPIQTIFLSAREIGDAPYLLVVIDLIMGNRSRRQIAIAARGLAIPTRSAKRGRHLTVNDRPAFIRGNLDDVSFTLTGYPSCDVDLQCVKSATRVNLEIAVRGTPSANDWNLWVFPASAARQLRKSLLDYAASPAFAPQTEITLAQLVRLFAAE